MARSMWSGSISFGLVNIPVKVFSAVSQKEVRFHMIHEEDGGRIKLKRVCSVDGEEVPYDEIAKGYELSKGRNVVLSREEVEALSPEASRAIAIEDFVELDDIDPIFYEHTYYLVPDKGAERSYALLLEAMRRTNKVGIARMVMRTKQYLCAVRPYENSALALSTMSYADEINSLKSLEDLPGKSAAPKDRELDMAEQLIGSLTTEWTPDKYHDTHREEVLELIRKKAEGADILAEAPAEERPAKVVSLMDALQKSLAAGRKASGRDAAANDDEDRGERRHQTKAARTRSSGRSGRKTTKTHAAAAKRSTAKKKKTPAKKSSKAKKR